MGEAKRRQQRDPNYGLPMITIAESTFTNNLLVLVDGVVLDSSIHYHEVEAIKNWLLVEIATRPLPKALRVEGEIGKWVHSSPRRSEYPSTTAEVMIFDQKTNTYKIQFLTLPKGH